MIQHYDEEVYDAFMDLFDNLPVSANVNGQYLAMHGGINRDLQTVE